MKLYGILVFFSLNGLLCYLDLYQIMGISVFLTFIMNLVCITIGFNRAVSNKNVNLDTIVWVFVYTFLFLAPVVQINYSLYFPNSLLIEDSYVIKANLLIFLWNATYLLFRRKYKTNPLATNIENQNDNRSFLLDINWKLRLLYFIMAILISLYIFKTLKWNYMLFHDQISIMFSNKSVLLLTSISFAGITFANWLFAFAQWRKKKSMINIFYFAVSSIIMLYMVNPINTNRSYIGFSLILIIYYFYHKKVSSSTFLIYIFFGLFVIFPFLNFYRFGITSIQAISLNELMFSQLTELHFDAYSNIIATFKYCQINGFSLGYQMLGVIFFFVPRNIWVGKPLSSGEAVGNYLSSLRSYDFNNISNPIVSEFYINFGVIGVVLGALLIVYLINKFESNLVTERYSYSLFAGYLFIIYRGDLMSAFAYCFGTYIIMVFIPIIVTKFMNQKNSAFTISHNQLFMENKK